jgi:hypothetical protein
MARQSGSKLGQRGRVDAGAGAVVKRLYRVARAVAGSTLTLQSREGIGDAVFGLIVARKAEGRGNILSALLQGGNLLWSDDDRATVRLVRRDALVIKVLSNGGNLLVECNRSSVGVVLDWSMTL